MDEILKSEILAVVLEKSESVSFEEFAGLFCQIHGYQFKLSNYGYSSLKSLLDDMKDLVELYTIGGQQFIKIRSPAEYHVVFFNSNHSSQKNLNIPQLCNVSLPTSEPSSGLVSTSYCAQPNSSQEDRSKVNSANCPNKKSKECNKSEIPVSAKSPDPSGCQENNPRPINSESSSNHENIKQKKTDESPTFATSPSHATIGSKLLTGTKPAKAIGFSSSSGLSNYSPPVREPKSAMKIGCASTSGSSSNSGTSTRPKYSSTTVASNKAKAGSPASSSSSAKAQLKSVTSNFTKAKDTSAKSTSTSKTSGTKNKIGSNASIKNASPASSKLKMNSKPKPNASSSGPKAAPGNVCPKKTGPSQKMPLLLTPQIPLKKGSYDVLNQNQQVQQGIRPNLSYAGACRNNNNMNQFKQDGQQFVRNNVNFNIHTTNVIQSYSRAQPRLHTIVKENSIVRENLIALLKKHASGMSMFQLQKIYLFRFQQPLACKEFPSIKQLLLGMKDVVKMKGVGVQMLVYPASAEDIPSIAADRHLGNADSMYAKQNKTQGVAITAPHVSSSLNKKDNTQHQTVSLPLCNDQSSSFGQNQMTLTGGQFTNYLGQMGHKQQILQNKQAPENGGSIPSTMQFKGIKMVEAPSCLGTTQEPDKAEWPALTSKLHALKDIKQFAVTSVQTHRTAQEPDKTEWPALTSNLHALKDIKEFPVASVQTQKNESKAQFVSKPKQGLPSQDQSCNANLVEIPKDLRFALPPPENVLHSKMNETGHLTEPPSSCTEHLTSLTHQHRRHYQAESSYSQTEQDMDRTITKNEPEQNASQSSDHAQLILHSSGFSIVMGKNNKIDAKEATEFTNPTVDLSPKASSQIASGIDNRMLVGSVHSVQTQQMISDTHSKSLPKTHQVSVSHPNRITQNTVHLLSQPHQTVQDSHSVAKSYQKEDDCQGRSRHEELEYPFSQSQKNITNTQNKNVLRSSASSEPQTQPRKTAFHIENALLETGSSSLHPQDTVLNLQTTGVFGQTGSPSSCIEHKVPNVFEKIASSQLQPKVTNYMVANESNQAGSLFSHIKLDYLPVEDTLGQTGTISVNSQEAVPSPQTMKALRQPVAVAPQSEQKVINSQSTNECIQIDSAESQSQNQVLGLQTGTQSSSPTKTRNYLRKVTSPASHTNAKTPDSVTENTPVQKAFLQSNQNVLDIQNKNLIGKTPSPSQQKNSTSLQQTNVIQHIFNSEQTKLMSLQFHQKLPQSYISTTSEQNGCSPMPQPVFECPIPKCIEHCDDLVSPPVQTVPQNSSGNSPGQREMGTWQTDKDQYCCIL